jgi:hypothetical protein
MKKSTIVVSAFAFAAASLAAISPAGAITFWGPTSPTQIINYTDFSTTVSGDFAQVRAGVLGGGVTAFINGNTGPFVNQASINCNTGTNASQLNGNSTSNANITLVCPWFGSTNNGQGSIESD